MVEGANAKDTNQSYNVDNSVIANYNNNINTNYNNNLYDNEKSDRSDIKAAIVPQLILQTCQFGADVKEANYHFVGNGQHQQQHQDQHNNADKAQHYGNISYININSKDPAANLSNTAACSFVNHNHGIKAGFEQAIELCGYGRFHYVLLAICGLVSTSEEMDVISMSFILPSAQCDLDLNTKSKGWLNSIIFIGMMVGAYFWGSIADSVGRKKVLIVISFMNGFCIVASSFTQTYIWFMLFRFLNGVALGGSGPVIWSYFAEFQPKSKRGSMLSFMAAFWTFGNLFVAGLAWLIIPTNIGLVTPLFIYNSWRIFLLVCSLPSFIVAILLFYLPESPKFLLSKGKSDKALAIFRGIFVTNTKRSSDLYPVGELDIDEKSLPAFVASGKNVKSKYAKMLTGMVQHSKELFSSPILKFTIISIVINLTFHIGYYGLMMWFPELFSRFEEYSISFPYQTASVCSVTEYVVGKVSQEDVTCSSHIPSAVFVESLISLASALPTNLIAIIGMDFFGRKFFLICGTMTAGICSAAMHFVYNSTQNLIVSAVFSGAISAANAALDCLVTEVFPTHLRATGVAISMVAARMGGIIGNIVIATLLDQYCPAPTFIIALLLIGGGLLCLLLPNTTRKELN